MSGRVLPNKTQDGWVCGTGELFKAREGDRLLTEMWYSPETDSFNSRMTNHATGEQSYLNASCPDYDCTQSWSSLIFEDGQGNGGKNMVLFFVETYWLAFFRDSMAIGTPVSATTANKDLQNAIDAPSSVALHNQLDLGGGSHIVPFVSNDLLNQRAYTLSGEAIPAEHLADGAISEGGIMLVVGRAGIHSAKFGYLMQGTVIKYGLFVVSSVGKYGNVEIWFADRKPMIPDLNGKTPGHCLCFLVFGVHPTFAVFFFPPSFFWWSVWQYICRADISTHNTEGAYVAFHYHFPCFCST